MSFSLSCGTEKDAERIVIDGDDREIESGVSSIAYIKSLYNGEPYSVIDDLTFAGVVVANDRYGNFYKVLVVEDSSAGIEIRIDDENLYKSFFIGDSLKVYCNGLTLGSYGGTVQIGSSSDKGDECSPIPLTQLSRYISKGGHSPQPPVATELSLQELSSRHLSCYVKINGVEFIDEELGLNWCDAGVATNRTLVDSSGNTLIVRTSPYAAFANNRIPKGSGFLCGILSTFAGRYQLIVIDSEDAEMSAARF